jgi:hypothetical protein
MKGWVLACDMSRPARANWFEDKHTWPNLQCPAINGWLAVHPRRQYPWATQPAAQFRFHRKIAQPDLWVYTVSQVCAKRKHELSHLKRPIRQNIAHQVTTLYAASCRDVAPHHKCDPNPSRGALPELAQACPIQAFVRGRIPARRASLANAQQPATLPEAGCSGDRNPPAGVIPHEREPGGATCTKARLKLRQAQIFVMV